MIPEEEAFRLIRKTSKYVHALTVACMMGELANTLGENGREWRLAGLLHDLDYDEIRNDMRKHGVAATEKNCRKTG
jgi:putative nucleotidyltransferase with HDIG domain